jgi:hypothetical protein
MMDLKRVAAVVAVTMAMTAPALAQGPIARSVPAENYLQAEQAYRHHYGSGFWPGDVAAGIVGGAIGTAGAIAAAPFGEGPYAYGGRYAYGGSYAYNDDAYPYDSYGQRGWFACPPRTRFRGEDGLIHMCQ